MGAASSSRWAPLSRSTMTPMPANMQLSGIEQADVADGDEGVVVDRRAQAADDLPSAGAITSANRIGRDQRDDDLARGAGAEREAPRGRGSRRGARDGASGRTAAVAGERFGGDRWSSVSFRWWSGGRRRAVRRSAAGRRRRASGRRVLIDGGDRPRSSMAAIASPAGRSCSGTRERRADGERVVAGDAAGAQRRERRAATSPSTRSSTSSRPRPASSAAGVSSATICAVVHDRDAVAEPLGLVEVVRREQDRHPAARRAGGDHVEQLVADARVEPDGRLVEEQHLRLGDERAGDLEPPPLAAAVGPDRPVDELGEAERVGELGDAPPPPAGSTPHSRACRSRLRAAGERPVDDRVLEDDAADARGPRAARGRRRSRRARAVPPVGTIVVVSMPIVVDLPAPFGPSRPNTSPGATSKSMPFTASTPPG